MEYENNDLSTLINIPGFIEGLNGAPGITYRDGLPQTVRYANGVTLSYTYDRNGRLDTRTDTHGGIQLFSLDLNYDPNGNITARTVNGNTNTYAYDDLNQLIHADLYARQVEQVRAYDYGLGQVHEDYRGEKVVEVQPEDFMVDLDYAATSLSVIFNQVAQNIQRLELTPAEANHRLTNKRYLAIYYKTSGDYQKLDPAEWEFALDAATGKITITFPDLLTAYEVKIHCLFDDRDKDYLSVKKRGTASEFANLARSMVRVYRVYERRYEDYIYDRNGNRISETITTLYPRTYGYTYYPNSDRLKTRESSDGTTKLAFVYDNNGNLIEKGNTYTIAGDAVTFTTSGEGVVYWQYEYDVFNRLVSVKKNGIVVSRYVYDPSGLRILKEATEIKVYDYDLAGNVIVEKNLTTGKVYSYVWVSGRHLARVDGKIGESGAAKYFYETDHLGSPMVVTNQSGQVVWRGDFTPFGEKVTGAGAWVFVDTHGFTGKDWDEDVGLYYWNARWYDSELGRFITQDPAADLRNPNLYSYAWNSPLSIIDPTGLQGEELFTFNIGAPDQFTIGAADPGYINLFDLFYIPVPYPEAGFTLPSFWSKLLSNVGSWAKEEWFDSVIKYESPFKVLNFGLDTAKKYAINQLNLEMDQETAVKINRAIYSWSTRFDRTNISHHSLELLAYDIKVFEFDPIDVAIVNITSTIIETGFDKLLNAGDKIVFKGLPVLTMLIDPRLPDMSPGDVTYVMKVMYKRTDDGGLKFSEYGPWYLQKCEMEGAAYYMTLTIDVNREGFIKEATWQIQEYLWNPLVGEWMPTLRTYMVSSWG